MAYPADTVVETAIGTIESVLGEDLTFVGNREDVTLWRKLLARIETRPVSGYDALTQTSDGAYIAEESFGAS